MIFGGHLDRHYPTGSVVVTDGAVNASSDRFRIEINGKGIGALKLNIDLKLKLKGLILKIQNARIKQIMPGSCMGSGTISFYGKTLVEKETSEFNLPGTVDLGEGIPIAR